MKIAGSSRGDRFEFYAGVAITPGFPSFGLPLFRSASGSFFGQVVDEMTGRISDFRPLDAQGEVVVAAKKMSQFRVGDRPALCIIWGASAAEGGGLASLKDSLEELAQDDTASVAVRLQAAALVNPAEERRLRRMTANTNDPKFQGPFQAYNRSLGRIVLWDKLIRAARNDEVAERTLQVRPQLDLDFNFDGRIVLHLGSISSSDYPSLDFSALSTAIEVELGLTSPSNDEFDEIALDAPIFSINVDNLKSFLNSNIGSDGRIRDHTYAFTVRLLNSLGFKNIEQVEEAIDGYSGRRLSYVAMHNLQGQTTKFELMLLAAMGRKFIERHPWCANPWFVRAEEAKLAQFIQENIPVKNYDPKT